MKIKALSKHNIKRAYIEWRRDKCYNTPILEGWQCNTSQNGKHSPLVFLNLSHSKKSTVHMSENGTHLT
jgi:hypothetical protein